MSKRRRVLDELLRVAARDGLPQVAVAERLRFSQATVSRWFSGRQLVSCKALARIAVAFPELGLLAFEAMLEGGREALEAGDD